MKRYFLLILIPALLASAREIFTCPVTGTDSILVFEDFESGTDNWTLIGNWGLEEGSAISGTHFLTESPGGNYTSDEISSAVRKNPVSLSGFDDAYMSFWVRYDIEDGFDFMCFEVSDDNGVYWERKKTWTGISSEWSKETVSLDWYAGKPQMIFRFIFGSDTGVEADGMHIDDITVYGYNYPNTGPYIYYSDAPVNYEGTLNEFKSVVSVADPDGVDSVWVEYTIRDFPDTVHRINALNTAEKFWEFTIPDYGPGSQIDFVISAKDASEDQMESRTIEYSYISGDHRIYDSGIVSYYKLIEDNQAMAVKISTEVYAPTGLVFVLIRNYRDNDHVSADMKFHVWADDAGVPGEDMIDPFTVTPEADPTNSCAFTRIDLRSYYLPLAGDFWIGISAFEGGVYSLMEAPYEEGTAAYERSYSGSWTGTEWSWSPDVDYNYHFRAVMTGADGMEEDLTLPVLSELFQNYPNPFNPATQISYSLAKEGQVKLSVYNSGGQLVKLLVDGMMTAGNHKVSFNADDLNSGIYFYTLQSGNTKLSRKMLLIK